jgi:Tfp pilus assembly protein PilF
MERCPTCQARLREEPVCARCRTDLSLPLAAEAQAYAKLHRAVARLGEGDTTAAREALEESLRLKRSPLAVALRGFLASREH